MKDEEFKEFMEEVLIKPEIPDLTETEIEEQQKPFTVNLKGSDGEIYPITMPLGTWDMFLAIFFTIETSLPSLVSEVKDLLNKNPFYKTESDIFIQYISELYIVAFPSEEDKIFGWDANQDKILRYLSSEGHGLYDQLEELQWRIDNKPRYIIPSQSFPDNPKILEPKR